MDGVYANILLLPLFLLLKGIPKTSMITRRVCKTPGILKLIRCSSLGCLPVRALLSTYGLPLFIRLRTCILVLEKPPQKLMAALLQYPLGHALAVFLQLGGNGAPFLYHACGKLLQFSARPRMICFLLARHTQIFLSIFSRSDVLNLTPSMPSRNRSLI